MHRLLERQLRKRFGQETLQDPRVTALLADVDAAYHASDADHTLLERSIDIASAELREQNQRLEQDLESIKRLELELRQADKLRAVGQLAAGIAHEINTPIQFIGDSVRFVGEAVVELTELSRLAAALCHELEAQGIESADAKTFRLAADTIELEELSHDLPRALRHAQEGLDRVSQLVQAMKQFGRPDQQEKVAVDVTRCLRDTLTVGASEFRHVADVVTEFEELPLLHCYPGSLNQVFLNLVVNAAHAIAQRFSGNGRGQIRLTTAARPEAIVVTVSDNGTGIDPTLAARIFEPFFTTKPVGQGTGQGLAISRSIVADKHSGTLTFESKLGEGTTFFVTLPLDAPRGNP